MNYKLFLRVRCIIFLYLFIYSETVESKIVTNENSPLRQLSAEDLLYNSEDFSHSIGEIINHYSEGNLLTHRIN